MTCSTRCVLLPLCALQALDEKTPLMINEGYQFPSVLELPIHAGAEDLEYQVPGLVMSSGPAELEYQVPA